MDPITIGAVAAPVVGGMVGGAMSAGDRNAATQTLQNIYSKYANLQLPDTEKMKLALQDYQNAGNLNLGTETAQQLGPTDAFQNISVDPRLRQAQMDQLQSMAKLGNTSFSPAEQAQLNTMQRNVESDNQSRLNTLLQQQQQRGVGSSDAGLAARMQGTQSAANTQATQADDLASMAFNRALQAKQAAGQLGGQMEGAQYGQAANLANALNAREQQNMLQKAGVGQRNIANFNQAQMYNTQNAQNIANQNTGLSNSQQMYNKQLAQQNYQNQLAQLAGMTGAGNTLAGQQTANANATAAMYSNIGGGLGKGLGGMAMAAKSTPTNTNSQGSPAQSNPLDFFMQGQQMPASNKDYGTTA